MVFKGKCNIGHGSKISVGQRGCVTFGENFEISAESSVICNKAISFGDDCLVSWKNIFMDTDFHTIMDSDSGQLINSDQSIIIGDRVWLGQDCTVLKGTEIENDVVVGAKSLLSSKYNCNNAIIAGNPAKVIKKNISWSKQKY